ncbi:hypothetical protein [Polaromonas sp. CG9_12]|nr:hypothetical protein [Polaromonas sp. CG9_12]
MRFLPFCAARRTDPACTGLPWRAGTQVLLPDSLPLLRASLPHGFGGPGSVAAHLTI